MGIKDITEKFVEDAPIFVDEEGNPLFTCKKCGGHDLLVKFYTTTVTRQVYGQPCKCGEGEGGLAYRREIQITEIYLDCYFLDDEHRPGWRRIARDYCEDEMEELKEEVEEEELEEEILCEKCFDPYEEGELIEETEEDISEEIYVVCAKCGREIEFGWSHPGGAGRIWPAEAKDFNPYLTWPEPRYRKTWVKRGWIRPDFLTEEDKEALKE